MTRSRTSPPRIVLWGLLAHAPFGGMVWQVLNHLRGLSRLGHDVWFVEDADQRMLDLGVTDWVMSAEENAAHVSRYLDVVGLSDRWVIRTPGSRECFGARDWDGLLRLYREADLVINLCGAHKLLDHHDAIGCLLYLETDPVANQVALASGAEMATAELARYDVLATYATNLGAESCLVPKTDMTWLTTVPPVDLDAWVSRGSPRSPAMTTVMNWSTPERATTWEGQEWPWSKQHALHQMLELPGKAALPLVLALRGGGGEVSDQLEDAGWGIVGARSLDRPGAYRRFIRDSAGEISVAKQQYTAPRSGWISDRTVCYLAAGRPAVVERTGIDGVPLGSGLLDFADTEEAAAAIESVSAEYDAHAAAARELAAEHFAADKVLGSLLDRAGLT